jgi:hypothetical protein
MKRQIRLGLAGLALAAVGLISAPAWANDYSGTCAGLNPGTFDGNGSVDITDSACTLGNVTATGHITITATSVTTGDLQAGNDLTISSTGNVTTDSLTSTGGEVNVSSSGGDVTISDDISSFSNTILNGNNVTTEDITSDWGIQATANSGALDLGELISNDFDLSFGGNVLLSATGNIETDDITNNGSTTTGGIEIHANTGGTSTVFNIGGGGSNGTGTLNVSTATGGGSDAFYIPGGIYITNGTDGSTGGITVNSMSDLVLTSTASRSAVLILDAKNGTLTLPTGSLTADGAAGYGAGQISLLANTISTADGTVITASQDSGADGTDHGVNIAAQTINLSGSTGLAVHGDGNGVSGDAATAYAYLMPQGGITVSSTSVLNSLYWTVDYNNYFSLSGSLTVSGGSAPFTATADGDDSEVGVSAYPISFSAGAVTLHARGASDHNVYIAYYGTFSGTSNLSFTGSGDVNIDANGDDGDGGYVQISVDHANVTSPNFNVQANGPSSGDGNGGRVYLYSSQLTIDSSTKASIQANAASSGEGDAVYGDPTNFSDPLAITFYPSTDVTFGTDEGQFSLSANGGASGGDGGTILTSSGDVTVATSNAISASGIGGDGNGGWIYINSYIVTAEDNEGSIQAVGYGDGVGGQVFAYHSIDSFDFDNIMKIDDGDSGGCCAIAATKPVHPKVVIQPRTASAKARQVTLNGITCEKFPSGDGDWPKYYWNCVTLSPDSPTTMDKYPTDVATSTLSPTLRETTNINKKISIVVFKSNSDYGTFFDRSWPAGPGETIRGHQLAGTTIYSNVWEKSPSSGNPYSEGTSKEATMHELGHAFDSFLDRSTQSGSSGYDTYVQNDFLNLDYAYLDPTSYSSSSNKGASVARLPCAPTPITGGGGNYAGTPPFANDSRVCTGTSQTGYLSMSNSAIARALPPQAIDSTSYYFSRHVPEGEMSPAWNELYAQSLAYATWAKNDPANSIPFAFKTPDNLFYNGYFSCSEGWGAAIQAGTTSPAISGCSNALPDWYSVIH